MIEVLKPLIENQLISEDVQQELTEAWEAKLTEAREMAKAELREEFAQRYEHDKQQLVEALDSMVTDSLTKEISEFVEDKKAVVKERVAYRKAMTEHTGRLNTFIAENLAKEMNEFRAERGAQTESFEKLENFVIKALAEEIAEFNKDKQDVIETKVRLVAGAKEKLDEVKDKFIKRSAKMVEETVTSTIENELTQLREDVQKARENQFGRQLFESFAAEYASSYLNEGTEVAKLSRKISSMEDVLAEANKKLEEQEALVESRNAEIRIIRDTSNRKDTMNDLLSPLAKDKREVMESLLESVKTEKLKASFDKYLPSVLNGDGSGIKRRLDESKKPAKRAVTGDRKVAKPATQKKPESAAEVVEMDAIKKLAGLK